MIKWEHWQHKHKDIRTRRIPYLACAYACAYVASSFHFQNCDISILSISTSRHEKNVQVRVTGILLAFLFRHHTNSLKLLITVFDQGWQNKNGLQIEKVRRTANLLWFSWSLLSLLVFQENIVCERMNLRRNPSGNWAILFFSRQKPCTRII